MKATKKRIALLIALVMLTALTAAFATESDLEKAEEFFLAGDYEKSFALFSAIEGDVKASAYLAHHYENGYGVEVNPEMAYTLYKEAADGGLAYAARLLARYHANGIHVDASDEAALEWHQKAVELGDPLSNFYLGVASLEGTGTEQNLEQAHNYFTAGSEMGEPFSKYMLATLYYNGYGVEADHEKAFALLSEFIAQIEEDGTLSAPSIYAEDTVWDIASDTDALYDRYSTSVFSLPDAMSWYGDFYLYGEGVEQNLDEALRWFTQAAELGSEKAQERLDNYGN